MTSQRVLVTGHRGYIGTRLVPLLTAAGHQVVGMDTDLFAGCDLGEPAPSPPSMSVDVRDATPAHLEGFDAVVHLAGISNDPLGDLNPDCTVDVNHRGTVAVARAAKAAGVRRFVQASTCSLYGAQGDDVLDESAAFAPVTVYGESKIAAEQALRELADDDFSPILLRNATVYGVSPRLRGDLVVNNLVGHAVTTGRVYLKSDGSPWRPLLHVEDAARAVLAVLHAPLDDVHDRAFNVGRTQENYRIREVAEIVEAAVPGSTITFADGAGPDLRNYRVSCERLEALDGYDPQWTVARGVTELVEAYRRWHLTRDDLEGTRYLRVRRVQQLLEAGCVQPDLRPATGR